MVRTEPNEPDSKTFKFESFSGGMRRSIDAAKIGEDEYPFLVNGRTRYSNVIPIKKPLRNDNLPTGKYQGCFGLDQYAYVFISGKCYYLDTVKSTTKFSSIAKFQLSPTVDTIYAESVPDSLFNFGRTVQTVEGSDIKMVTLNTGVNVQISESGIVVQDGINQGRLIYNVNQSRVLKKFSEWLDGNPDEVKNQREYVPKGLNMLYHDGILYMVSPDRRSLYRSVTGRPLDFVIALGSDGNKLTDNLFTEEAERLAHRVNGYRITALGKLNVGTTYPQFGTPFMVSTAGGSYRVIPNFDFTLFSEPTFRNVDLFSTGILNQAAFTFARGDIHFIDETGLRSFNAVEQSMVVSKDDALSGPIYRLFENIEQSITCCTFFDNYTLFGVNTIYGPAILVYDNLLQRFAGLDIFDGIGFVKQFCQTVVNGTKKLFFITEDGFYEYYGSDTTANCGIYLRESTVDDQEKDHKIIRIKLSFLNSTETGTVNVTPFIDGFKEDTIESTITPVDVGSYTVDSPMGNSVETAIPVCPRLKVLATSEGL